MARLNIVARAVTITSGNTKINGYLATPAELGQFPGIIVFQEVFGVNPYIRAVTERIASLGYVAIAPALFDRTSPGFDVGYSPAELELGRTHAQTTSATELLADIQGCVDYLKSLPQVAPNFGCIGFCFGGHVAYLAATLPDIAVTASFYGRGITTFSPGGGEPTVSQTGSIAGTIYMFFGMNDASIPPEHVAEIATTLTQHHIPHRIWQYPDAEHGFCCDLRASYNPTAAEDAWQHVEELFQQLATVLPHSSSCAASH
jgi:carboxymethylenebutenolidase